MSAGAADHEVGLLLLAMLVPDGALEVRRVAPVADADVARLHRRAAEAALDAFGAAGDDVIEFEQVDVRVWGAHAGKDARAKSTENARHQITTVAYRFRSTDFGIRYC